mmetsp:Transcript_28271/g.83733  ORF Transcript_28271/g.83733 Transcript_28271/m.83733 type:complete len:479 (-) Transcript_28271:236-1672(-)
MALRLPLERASLSLLCPPSPFARASFTDRLPAGVHFQAALRGGPEPMAVSLKRLAPVETISDFNYDGRGSTCYVVTRDDDDAGAASFVIDKQQIEFFSKCRYRFNSRSALIPVAGQNVSAQAKQKMQIRHNGRLYTVARVCITVYKHAGATIRFVYGGHFRIHTIVDTNGNTLYNALDMLRALGYNNPAAKLADIPATQKVTWTQLVTVQGMFSLEQRDHLSDMRNPDDVYLHNNCVSTLISGSSKINARLFNEAILTSIVMLLTNNTWSAGGATLKRLVQTNMDYLALLVHRRDAIEMHNRLQTEMAEHLSRVVRVDRQSAEAKPTLDETAIVCKEILHAMFLTDMSRRAILMAWELPDCYSVPDALKGMAMKTYLDAKSWLLNNVQYDLDNLSQASSVAEYRECIRQGIQESVGSSIRNLHRTIRRKVGKDVSEDVTVADFKAAGFVNNIKDLNLERRVLKDSRTYGLLEKNLVLM